MSRIATMCAGVLLIGAAPALAQAPQPKPLAVVDGQPFRHANSGVTLPATLAGMTRIVAREFEAPELDVNVEYATADRGEDISVYVYRSTAGALPVWFDRAIFAVEHRPGFGTTTRIDRPAPFAPPGRDVAAGLIAVWSLAGGAYGSTALAIAPLGEWTVKFRYSSKTLDPAALEAGLREAISAIGWPATLAPASAAVPIADCPAPLAFEGKAKSVKPDGASALLGALIAGMSSSAVTTTGPPATWCRDPAQVGMTAIYRPNGATDSYLLALSDSGRGIVVTPDAAGQVMDKGKRAGWAINLILPGRAITYPTQDRLPSPARVAELFSGAATSSTTTWGNKREVTLPPSALK